MGYAGVGITALALFHVLSAICGVCPGSIIFPRGEF